MEKKYKQKLKEKYIFSLVGLKWANSVGYFNNDMKLFMCYTVPCVSLEGASEGQEDKAERLSLSCSHMTNDGGWAESTIDPVLS